MTNDAIEKELQTLGDNVSRVDWVNRLRLLMAILLADILKEVRSAMAKPVVVEKTSSVSLESLALPGQAVEVPAPKRRGRTPKGEKS